MAAEHKKHIHMEKPGGLSLPDFERLIGKVKANGTVFHTGYMYRYNPAIKDIFERVKSGEIGEVISVEAQMSGWRGIEQTKWLSTFEGGMMFYLGCHLIDLVLSLQGKPKRVIPFNKSSGVYDCDSKDFSFALFEYERGVSFVKTTQAERGGFERRQLVITGTKGKFEVRPLEITIDYPLQYTEYRECKSEDWNDTGVMHRSPDHDRYTDMIRSFGKMVLGEIENPYTPDYELELFRTITECCK
jgi:predicted dehydrogenase